MLLKIVTVILSIALGFSVQAEECSLSISGSDMMQFDKTILEVGSECTGAKITVRHSGSLAKNMMGHNVVIVATENFDSVIASISMEAGLENGYLGDNKNILLKTIMIGGGEFSEETLDLTKFTKGGDYTFFCSFPGHYAIMKGKFVI